MIQDLWFSYLGYRVLITCLTLTAPDGKLLRQINILPSQVVSGNGARKIFKENFA